jgi:uncharacterized membrane protein
MSQQPTGDWIKQFVDSLERIVARIRKVTTEPAIKAVRGLVFGLIAAVLGLVVAVLMMVFTIHLLSQVGRSIFATGAWFAYVVLGGIFVLVGLLLMRKRHAAPEAS